MLPERNQVLIVDDEPNLRKILSAQLSRDGYDVLTAEDGEQGLALLKDNHIDLVISDLKMPKVDGMTLLRKALIEDPELPVILITAHGTIDTAVEALKAGAFDFVTKPFDKDEVRQIVSKALKTRELRGADATPASAGQGARFGIIGSSQGILDLYAILERVADTPKHSANSALETTIRMRLSIMHMPCDMLSIANRKRRATVSERRR